MKKPPLSVIAVINTLDPTAGSRPNLTMSIGINTPKSAATNKLNVMATAITRPKDRLWYSNMAKPPMIPPHTRPLSRLMAISFSTSVRALVGVIWPKQHLAFTVGLDQVPHHHALIAGQGLEDVSHVGGVQGIELSLQLGVPLLHAGFHQRVAWHLLLVYEILHQALLIQQSFDLLEMLRDTLLDAGFLDFGHMWREVLVTGKARRKCFSRHLRRLQPT